MQDSHAEEARTRGVLYSRVLKGSRTTNTKGLDNTKEAVGAQIPSPASYDFPRFWEP